MPGNGTGHGRAVTAHVGGRESLRNCETSSSGWRARTRSGEPSASAASSWASATRLAAKRYAGTCTRLAAARRPKPGAPVLQNHASDIWACDFFTVPTLSFRTLYVFFFIEHGRRKLVHLNVTAHPTADWVWRQLIQATPWGDQPRFLLRDRDASFGKSFASRARAIGIETVLSPFRCPQANGIAERMVGTFRQQCLDHVIVLNERHLLRLLTEYVEYYNGSKPHRSLELSAPQPRLRLLRPLDGGRVVARPVLGGLHHEYDWEAA